ncbi:MAG: SAM-dependent methyltransferase [Chloroflexi bacterium CFX6]|nr:SAM-dependent methyltransferase [Chloroflexi bacterium CFX6]
MALVAADATALPLADGSADRVLMLDVVEHLHPWQLAAALAEVRRIVRSDGYVIIHTLPNRWALAIAYPWLRLARPDLPAQPRSDYERAVHVNEQDPWRLHRALGSAGLASRVWVEDWTTRHAARAGGRRYPDPARDRGYAVAGRPLARRLMRLGMATPLRWALANDIFALAWPAGASGPGRGAKLGRVR